MRVFGYCRLVAAVNISSGVLVSILSTLNEVPSVICRKWNEHSKCDERLYRGAVFSLHVTAEELDMNNHEDSSLLEYVAVSTGNCILEDLNLQHHCEKLKHSSEETRLFALRKPDICPSKHCLSSNISATRAWTAWEEIPNNLKSLKLHSAYHNVHYSSCWEAQ
jgi:hypothetical protein